MNIRSTFQIYNSGVSPVKEAKIEHVLCSRSRRKRIPKEKCLVEQRQLPAMQTYIKHKWSGLWQRRSLLINSCQRKHSLQPTRKMKIKKTLLLEDLLKVKDRDLTALVHPKPCRRQSTMLQQQLSTSLKGGGMARMSLVQGTGKVSIQH